MLLRTHPQNPNKRNIQHAVNILKNGGVIIYPTDTVYAFGCALDQVKAVDRICQIKGGKKNKKEFSLAFKDISQVAEYTKPISNAIFKILKSNLPGPFTFILEAGNNTPKWFKEKKKTIGIRIPDNNIAQAIIEELGSPIFTTSVKNSDEIIEYITDPEDIMNQFGNLVDTVIDGGFCNNQPSTVVDCTGNEIEILREGLGKLR